MQAIGLSKLKVLKLQQKLAATKTVATAASTDLTTAMAVTLTENATAVATEASTAATKSKQLQQQQWPQQHQLNKRCNFL